MGNYVSIKTSITDLLNSANTLSMQGEALTSQVQPLIDDIRNRSDTAFPMDDYTKQFLEKYREPVKGPDDKMHPTDDAVLLGVAGVGEAMKSMGDFVTKVMYLYLSADEDNAAGIAGSGGS